MYYKGNERYYSCDQMCLQRLQIPEDGCTVVYYNLNTKIREVDLFSTRLNKGHHIGKSLLFALDIGMISKFPLGYIHTYTIYT